MGDAMQTELRLAMEKAESLEAQGQLWGSSKLLERSMGELAYFLFYMPK